MLRKKIKRKSNVKLIESAENKDMKGLHDPNVERDIVDLMKNYLKGDCWKDFLANIPFLLYLFIEGVPTELSEIEEKNNDWMLNLVMALKIFRLSHADEIADAITRLMDLLSEIFWRKKFLFYNMLRWILAAVKFLLAVHYFACGWILIHRMKQQFGWVLFPFNFGTADWEDYVESFYLITTTITTVGYGDFKGFLDTDGMWLPEMLYLYFVTLFGIILFSLVTREIFTYEHLLTVEEMVNVNCKNLEDYLNDVSRVQKHRALD